ncbi:hypothetical protein BX070DRAFT_122741 [Coemansia spiralis]|nr:hypothetical protein BX070DRAFT_122741 [Coemansia spiralis]
MGHEKRLNMPIDKLPLSLELLCEHAGIPWRPPTDHFEPLEGVRVILHINCLYLPDEDLLKTTLQEHDVEAVDVELTKILQQKPDKRELENRAAQLFQETMSLSSLVDKSFDPVTIVSESGAANKDMDLLPSAVVAKQHINAQMATLKGLPHDQLELVRHCHRRFVRFIAQETLYALRDIIPATVPLLNQVWHTIATTVDEDVPSDKFEFSQNKLDLRFVIDMPDVAKRRHAVQLVMSELLKQDGAQPNYPLGKLEELGGIVYMRDVRSRSARIEASARMRARALSDTHYVAGARKADGVKEYINTGPEDLTDAIPSWFLIKPTSNLDGVRILTHNYSIVTNEVADNVLAAIRQRLMVALKAANTRLLLEELAETHRFPDLLVLPDAARAKLLHRSGSTRLGSQSSDQHTMRDGAISIAMQQSYNAQSSTAQSTTGAAVDDRAQRTNWPRDVHSPANTPAATSFYPGPSSRNPFNIASILKPYIPDSPEFYSCDEQFTHVFPLHPRISPPRAAQAVLASGMMNNRLVNQRNMFFVRDGSSIFYALLTIDRIPYVNPFGINRPSRGPKAAISLSSVPGQAATFTSPLYSTDAIMPGAHTIATTSPNATVYESYRNGSRTLLDPSIFQTSTDTTSSSASASHAQVGGTFGDDIRRRSPLIPPIGGTERGGFLSHVVSTPAMTSRGMDSIISASADGAPVSPRIGGSETALMGGNRYSLAEAVTSHHSVSATPESPSNRYLGSLLTNLEESNLAAGSSRRRVADPPRSPVISQRDGSIHAQPTSYIPQPDEARLPLGASDRRLTETQNFEADVGGRMTQFLSNVNTPNIDSLAHNDGTAIAHAEERSVPCIVLHIYGVDKPSKEMTKSLVQQIRERITVHVTMPEMSDMLLRRVALNDHDMDFLFPMCNPEPVILYMPLPRFVHDVDKLILYFRQALGEIISPFPPSDLLAKAIRRSFNHLRRRHSDDGGFRSRTGINTQVPNSLRDDIIRLMDGWEYDQQIPGRVPFEKLVYLYNFYTKSGAPPPEMTDIGTGIAIVAALPLTRERTLPKRIWESLVPQADSSMQQEALGSGGNSGLRPETQAQNADDVLTMASDAAHRTSQSSVHRRAASYFMDVVSNALTPNQQQPSNLSPAQQTSKLFQRRASHTPSLHDNQQQQSSHSSSAASLLDDGECSSVSDNSRNSETHGADGARPNNYEATRTIPPSEIAKLFSEYLRQFKEAHAYLRLEASDYANIEELMDNQVKEFEGEQVVAITLWSNASVRLDRLSAYVSRVYWNALGDYVSESILYPILYAGWGDMADPLIKIPDPFADLEPCNSTLSLSGMSSRSKSVLVPLYSKVVEERSAAQARLALLRTRDNSVPRAPSTFTENTKTQMHAMEVARQMAQYWGRQEKVPSLCYHRQNLPRVTGISHWFSDELYDVLQTMCPSMHPARFRLLENPLVLNGTDREIGDAPKSLFPAHTLRKTDARENTDVVYDLSALPKALKGTRQSYCIMCTLPLEEPSADQLQRPASSSFRGDKTHSSSVGSVSVAAYAPSRRVDTLRKHNAGVSGHHRPSAHSSLSSGGGQNQMHGLGLQGWVQGDSSQNMSPSSSNLKLQQKHYYSSHKYPYSRIGDAGQQDRRPYRLPAISERRSASSGPKKMPPQSEYKPIADPETPVLSVDEITHYSSHGKSAMVSTISWLIIWLIGGELEMVGYNVSKRLWDNVCDQIKQRLERESRRKQLLGMFASHIGGIFPGFDRQARHKGLTSTWLDRNVTRDLINKFALQKQVAMDDQIHYFNIERHLSPEYLQILGLFDGSDELEKLISNPPMADMTLNDMKTELVLRQLQSEHLRWARKLTFVDYTQPYVDTRHPDTLFRIGSRYMRAYQSRLWNVLRYDELMRVAERWRQLAVLNGLSYSMGQSARMLGVDMHTFSLNSSSHEGYSIASHASYSQMPSAPAESMGTIARRTSSEQSDTRIQAPSRRDRHEEYAASRGKGKALAVTAPAAAPPAAIAAAATSPIISKDKPASEISLDNIKMVMESARLLHFVCAPLPISSTIKPAGTDLRAFKRLFNVISAMLQNLADSYINYLCSTGYAIAKRYEKEYTWKRALESLGYPPDKIASFTRAFLGRSASTFAQIRQSVESQEESLPRIIIPSAYLFANTDRSSLVTEVEVNPEMLSIRMHALGRFTPEWRSAVPGYVRSSVNQRSIKTFTFELSKFKKLLHAKSFVYDFQLRYVTYLLRSADSLILHPFTSDQQDDQLDDRLADEFQSGAAVYSSDSENGETDNPYESAESGDSDLDEVVLPSSQMPAGSGTFENKNHKGSGGSGSRRRTVAQALHVHIDLTVFFYHLSEQRYYSTRFSSRRLVKAQFPMVHRELYEYFLDHSERYYFYAEGCRPPMQHMADNSHPNDTVPAADLCTELASHSGCYRLYEGVLPDSMHTMYGSHTFGSEPGSDPESYVWQQMAGDRSSMYHSGSHGMGSRPVYGHHADGPSPSGIPIASSAPVPTSKMEYARGKSTDNDHSGGQPHLHPFNIKGRGAHLYAGPGLTTTQSYTTGVHPRLSDHRKQMAASYAAGSKRLDIPTGHVDESRPGRGHGKQNSYGTAHFGMAATSATHHVGTNTSGYSAMYVPSPSPLYANQTAKNLLHDQQHQVSAWTDQSGRSKSLEHALSEYSMCRIHLSSNDSSVRVSLMALTPDCDSCRSENNLASQRRKERQLSHAEALNGNAENSDKKTEHHRNHRHHRHHHHHHHHRNRKHGAEEQIYTENQPDSSKACNTQNQRDQACSTRALDNISDLFSPPKSKFKLGHKHSNRLYNPHATSASATDISAPRKSIGGGIGSGSVGMSGLRSDHHHKRNVLSQSSYSGGGPEMRDDQKHRYPQQQSFKRWMASLASNIITDPEVDGLCSLDNSANGDNQGGSQAQGNPGQLSYYLIVDMDPQTTIGLSNLDINDTRSRNGSLGQLPDYLSDVYGSSDDEMSLYGMRQCSKCKHLSKEAGGFKLCGTHRVLSMFQIDMRDWENKGNVWANEPTMVMEVSAIDPDEYEKEDLDVLSWIKKTAKRIIQYTAMDYHRDLNWYRIFQHIRMADLPGYLVPDDIFELIGFVERQSSMDVGAIDEAVQQLVALDIPAEHVIRSLQLRLRHLYLEPTLLMSSLHPAPQGQQPSTDGSNSQRHCNSHMNVGGAFSRSAVAGVGTTPPSSPTAEPLPLAVTRVPTIDRQSPVCAAESRNDVSTCQPDAVTSGMNVHILPSNPLCPIAAVDAHGRIVPSKSSYNIGDVLRLLSPLETRVNRRALLDPAFQKILGRYMQLDIISSPWLCKKHRCVTSAPVQKKWSFDEAAIAEDTEDRITEQQVTQRATQGRQTDISATQSTNRRVQQVQDSDGPASSTVSGRKRAHGGRAGASISLLIGTEPLSSPSMQPQQQSLSLSMTDPIPAHSFGSTTAQKVTTDAQHNTTTAATSTPAQASTDATASGTGISGFGSTATGSADCFLRPLVEALPGSLLIIDPSGDQYIARLLLLNPFACHSMLEILFERAPDGNGARLSQIRTVARDRQRDGLYEYERKHINMVLSTVSAVVWDVMTQGDSV